MRKIHFISLGCDKNLVDSEVMLGLLGEAEFIITAEPSEAHVVIINTCGFISDAVSEGIQTILEMAEYKKSGQLKTLVITGCMVQRYKEEIFNELPEVDCIVGVNDFAEIVKILEEASEEKKLVRISENGKLDDSLQIKRRIATPGHFAHLKIAEGCDNKCTYCAIPSIRGGYRSRSMESLVAEAEMLASKGVREIVLVAQDTTNYGIDLYGKGCLVDLIRRVSAIEGIEWIRILYAYPENITDELIHEISSNPKVCHYIDMPIQHSEDTVLKRMGRRSSNAQLREVISKLRGKVPDIALRTTLITGFPGETDQEFQGLMDFVKEMRFDRLGVFAYSQEDGTAASLLPLQVDEDVKNQRRDKLMATQNTISRSINRSYIGKELWVITDGYLPEEGTYCGRSYRDAYDIDGMVFFESAAELITGDFVRIKVTEASEYDLIGEII